MYVSSMYGNKTRMPSICKVSALVSAICLHPPITMIEPSLSPKVTEFFQNIALYQIWYVLPYPLDFYLYQSRQSS